MDLSFGAGTGKVTTPIQGTSEARSIALQADGKIVIGGNSYDGTSNRFVVARYNIDGSLDTTFNGTGTTLTSFAKSATINSILVQSDGKIVAAGEIAGTFSDSEGAFALARYNGDGTLDASFNGTGQVTTDLGPGQETAYSVALDGAGRIIAAGLGGFSFDQNLTPKITVARYRSDGTLDDAFGHTGVVTTLIGSKCFAFSTAVQEDGKIVAAGVARINGRNRVVLVRYNVDGTLDRTFNGTGHVLATVGKGNAYCGSIAIQRDGKIVAAEMAEDIGDDGLKHFGLLLARYTTQGKLDPTFHGPPKPLMDFEMNGTRSLAIQPDGKLLVAGDSPGVPNRAFIVMRFTASGESDATFNGSGRVSTPIAGNAGTIFDMAVQPDGRILIGGSDDHSIAVVRYLGDPQLDVGTTSATAISSSAATLHGVINPKDEAGISVVFDWGTSPSALDRTTPPTPIQSGTAPVIVDAMLTGLNRGTIYYYRLRAIPYGSQTGSTLNFATISNNAPGVISQAASSVVADAATLNAAVNPNSLATTAHFEWGSTTNYGNVTSELPVADGEVPMPLSAVLTGLTTDQTYHFRAVATSEAGTTNGPDRTFTPSAGAPLPQDDVVLIDGVATIRVLDNDIDPNGDILSLIGTDPDEPPHSGSVQTLGNLVFYTPDDGMLEDEFGYIVQDSTGKRATARVRAYRLSEIRGQYFGVLGDESGTGQLNMEIGPSGAFSLMLTWQGFDYALKGRLDSDRSFVTPLKRQGVEPNALLLLEIRFDPLSGQIAVQLTDSVLGGPFVFDAPRSGDADEAVDAVRDQLYTTSIDVPDALSPAQQDAPSEALNLFADRFRGSGFASVKIAKNRSARFVGQMPDTAKFSAGSPVSRRSYALYSALYKAKTGALGSVSGRATLQSNFELRSTSLTWQREADARDDIFAGKFSTPAFLNGDRYTPPSRGQLLQIGLGLKAGSFSNANLALTLGGLNPDVQQRLNFVPGGVRVTGENPDHIKLAISPATGTFSGSFTHTASLLTTKFSGIFITSPFQIREGRGSFRGIGAGGKVRIARP